MKELFIILFFSTSLNAFSQEKIESISFNLYTDSLKKGVYNYINVDGKTTRGSFLPLMDDEIEFKSTAGRWIGNSLLIDSITKADSVIITACLKNNPQVKKDITIYLKKITTEPPLKSEAEIIEGYKKKGKRG